MLVATALLVPAAPASAADPAVCHIDYAPRGDAWSFNGQITITNTGTVTLYSWTLSFTLPDDQTFTSGWEATFTADGQDITATSLPYNSIVAPEKSVSVAFHATGDVTGPHPAEFRINDNLCTAASR